MIEFKTGNILKADTHALVNTVNCEGYMGKGIAYQFKLEFPKNNALYEDACRSGLMKTGKVLAVEEAEKFIINFPTKNKWRLKSQYSYIEDGLKDLKTVIKKFNIESIAIPPLGCGNGGLEWPKVKELLTNELKGEAANHRIVIFEPSLNIKNNSKAKKPPKLNASHLILMNLKQNLQKFNKIRLQKTAFLMNYLSGENYFKFEAHHFGPYAHSLEILSKQIKEYQDYYGFTTEKAYKHAKNVLISQSIVQKENTLQPSLEKATDLVNSIESDKELELLTTLLYLIKTNNLIERPDLIAKFQNWSDRKTSSFSIESINESLDKLSEVGLIQDELYGLSRNDVKLAMANNRS